jgi:DNA polymerase III delta prime subunit
MVKSKKNEDADLIRELIKAFKENAPLDRNFKLKIICIKAAIIIAILMGATYLSTQAKISGETVVGFYGAALGYFLAQGFG